MKQSAGLDPNYWVNVRTPRVNKALTAHDIHQRDRHPITSPKGRPEYRGAAARARRSTKKSFRRLEIAKQGVSFRTYLNTQTTGRTAA
jgi:hypothetical protein